MYLLQPEWMEWNKCACLTSQICKWVFVYIIINSRKSELQMSLAVFLKKKKTTTKKHIISQVCLPELFSKAWRWSIKTIACIKTTKCYMNEWRDELNHRDSRVQIPWSGNMSLYLRFLKMLQIPTWMRRGEHCSSDVPCFRFLSPW